MSGTTALAIDIGASSGRAVRVTLAGGSLSTQEIHRFANLPYRADGQLRWNFSALLAEVRLAIAMAGDIDSVGFDTWGVDFGLLDASGQLLGDPVHYRDARTDGYPDRARAIMAADELYRRTGNQLMPLNTLFQLLALKNQHPEQLERARTLLFMPDLFAFHLGASPSCERTIASTSQMLDPVTQDWSPEVLTAYGIPKRLLLPPVASGTPNGRLAGGVQIVTVAGHDTQCAVAALPCAAGDSPAFLSCGTWGLLGTELDAPILTPASRALGLSNELGANGKINYLRNLVGLWLIQESRRAWKQQGQAYSYAELEALGREAAPLRSFIDPSAPEFAATDDIPGQVRTFCRSTGQPVPESAGAVMRCLYESLALSFRTAVLQLQAATGKTFKSLHIVGGGARDGLLCQLSADATGLPVIAGPAEAAALGNALIQFTALGALPSLEAGRTLVARCETLKYYSPLDTAQWKNAIIRYPAITRKGAM